MTMRSHRLANQRHKSTGRAKVIWGKGVAKQTPLPPLKENEVRCECGRGVRLNKEGYLMSHKTLISKVSCIYSYTEPVL